MKCLCGAEFAPRKNQKTCSPKCSAARTAKRQREYNLAHPRAQRIAQLRSREVVRYVSVNRKLNRAVRILFNLTGDQHYEN